MAAPKLNKPEGLAALIGAAMYAAKRPETMKADGSEFQWVGILSDFQEYNCIKFAAWCFGVSEEKAKAEFARWKAEAPAEEPTVRISENAVEFKVPKDEPEPTI